MRVLYLFRVQLNRKTVSLHVLQLLHFKFIILHFTLKNIVNKCVKHYANEVNLILNLYTNHE